ncbi:MAG TPA: chemotaxis protein CheA [Thermoanaerobaculia bacterium]|nr:chemotaxis protein CheA [Thermoanaerobaculia bacterium]
MPIDFEALLQTFLAEARDNLETMESDLLFLEHAPDDRDRLHDVFRLAHTLKGDAASLGFPHLSRYAHRMEDYLEAVRAGKTQLTAESITMLLLAVDSLRGMLARAAAGAEEERTEDEAGISRLTRLIDHDGLDVPADRTAPAPPAGSRTVEPAAGPNPATGRWPIFGAPSPPEAKALLPTLRVAIERLDVLVDRVGELGIARGRIANLLAREEVSKAEVLELHREHDRLHAELQDLVLELRMVPIGPVFRGLERIVRDLSARRGKEVRLGFVGEEVEVDAGLAEHLRAPLAHMARNAVDHGIEVPAERRMKGKEPAGTILLSAFRDGNSLVVELADDGRGLDRRKILAKAREAGLLPASNAEPEVVVSLAPQRLAAAEGARRSEEANETTTGPDEEEIDRLVLLPGFSTAEAIDESSGRGVGLDVVRRTIESLRGRVDLISRKGQGTTIRLRLPLALGLLDGLAVAVGGETYIVPLEAVDEVIDRPAGEGSAAGVVALRGEALSYVRLRDLLAVPGESPEREQLLVVSPQTERSGGKVGLGVDALLGREQIVIRPLAPLFEGLPGLAGSTILGSGEVAFVLDLASLLRPGARGAGAVAV